MRLYCFSESSEKNNALELAEWETDEVIFRKEFSKIQKDWTVVDVGSEFGYYAIKAALLVGNGGKVLAIEANPKTYQVLKMNIKLYNLFNRIIPVCKAAGKETGQVTLRESASIGGSSIVSLRLSNIDRKRIGFWLQLLRRGDLMKIIVKKYQPLKYVVHVNTLDKMVKEYELKKVDLIKIDVEGAELDVLNGSLDILKKDRPILLIEVHFGYGWEPDVLYKLLQRFGYSLTIDKRSNKALVVAH